MTLRSTTKHGNKPVHVEVARPDELPAGVPAPARPAATRDGSGKFTASPGTAALAREGAKAAHQSRQLAELLGMWVPEDDHAFAPYARLARDWRDAHMASLAANVGGGEVDPGAASVISTAALELAASRWLFDTGAKAGDAKMLLDAGRLGDASRQNVLAAFELAAKAAARRPDPAHEAMRRAQADFQARLMDRQLAQPATPKGAPTGQPDAITPKGDT